LKLTNGRWHLRDPRAAALIRQNLGTIIDIETLKVRLKAEFQASNKEMYPQGR
jgi:ATP-dependent Lhr-like helicase